MLDHAGFGTRFDAVPAFLVDGELDLSGTPKTQFVRTNKICTRILLFFGYTLTVDVALS